MVKKSTVNWIMAKFVAVKVGPENWNMLKCMVLQMARSAWKGSL